MYPSAWVDRPLGCTELRSVGAASAAEPRLLIPPSNLPATYFINCQARTCATHFSKTRFSFPWFIRSRFGGDNRRIIPFGMAIREDLVASAAKCEFLAAFLD